MRRYKGSWHQESELLFPGYVFLSATDRLKPDEEKKGRLVCIEQPEEQQLAELASAGQHLPMSKGYIKDGVTCVTEGPLRGKERLICKIDRHKRLAKVQSPLGKYREKGLWTGLEIVSRT